MSTKYRCLHGVLQGYKDMGLPTFLCKDKRRSHTPFCEAHAKEYEGQWGVCFKSHCVTWRDPSEEQCKLHGGKDSILEHLRLDLTPEPDFAVPSANCLRDITLESEMLQQWELENIRTSLVPPGLTLQRPISVFAPCCGSPCTLLGLPSTLRCLCGVIFEITALVSNLRTEPNGQKRDLLQLQWKETKARFFDAEGCP